MSKALISRDEFPRFPSVFSSHAWDDLWDGLWNGRDLTLFDEVLFGGGGHSPYDVIQTKDAQGNVTGTEFNFALAGFKPQDVTIEVDENELRVKVEKAEKTEDPSKTYVHRGLARRKMEYSYVLGGQVDKDNIAASFDDGMLKINLPSLPKKEVKKIEVKSLKQIAVKSESAKDTKE